jgi:uncharacterized protein (DUF2384 family)
MAEAGTSLAEAIEWLEMPIDGLGDRDADEISAVPAEVED